MRKTHMASVLLAALAIDVDLRAANSVDSIPPESIVAKANPAWQRFLLSSLNNPVGIGAGGYNLLEAMVEPAAGIKGKIGQGALKFHGMSKGSAKGDYGVAGGVGGDAKALGMWVYLPDDANVSQVGFQIEDVTHEILTYMVEANWKGWRWIEVETNSSKWTQAYPQADKNSKIDVPLHNVHIAWFAPKPGPTAIIVNELVAVSDMGQKTLPNPVTVGKIEQVALEPGSPLHAQVLLTNQSNKDVAANLECVIQEDSSLYSKIPPHPLYGVNVAAGVRAWSEAGGKTNDDIGLTDGKIWTGAGTPYNDKEKWGEAFIYVDLGKSVSVVHMDFAGGDANWMRKMDFAASADGKEYRPVEGLQNMDFFHKWGPQQIDVPHAFDARYIRIRCHNDGGERIPTFSFPAEFAVYAGIQDDSIFEIPNAGPTLLSRTLTPSVPANGFAMVDIGDGRAAPGGSLFAAVRTKVAGQTQLNFGRIFTMPPAAPAGHRDSRFGMNSASPRYGPLIKRQGNSWVRFENLKWPFVSPSSGVYNFTGVNPPHVPLDDIFKAYHDEGLSILPYLFLTARYMVPKGAPGEGETYPPTDPKQYGDFAYQAAARYGSTKHPASDLLTDDKVSGLGYINTFELWNEADLNDMNWGSWRGKFEDYYVMYRYGAEAIKKADPKARVSNGGWSGMDVPLMETMRNYKYPDGKCPLDFTDVLSVHYYSFQTPPELATINDNTYRDGTPLNDLTFEQSLDALVAWRDKYKPQMPIWLTETGYDSGGPHGTNERSQAAWLPRDIMMILAAGVDKVMVFREKGSTASLFASCGMVRDDDSLAPCYFTYATAIHQLDGVTEKPIKLALDDSNVRAYLWKRGDKQILTAWAIEGVAQLDLPVGSCTVTDAFGRARKIDGKQPLALTEFPVYLTDFSDPTAQRTLDETVRSLTKKAQDRLDRQRALQAYLFEFATKTHGATLVLGDERKFIGVLAGDKYNAATGYGFETTTQRDGCEKWYKKPYAVGVAAGSRFSIKAKPGKYELRVFARNATPGKFVIRNVVGGDQTLQVPESKYEGSITSAQIQAGEKPVSVQFDVNCALVWMTLVEVDAQK